MNVRVCRTCGEEKPVDYAAKQKTRAYGWMGNQCWACYVEAVDTKKMIARKFRKGREVAEVIKKWFSH